jgi:DNA-binding MarR family transcriptional regulator
VQGRPQPLSQRLFRVAELARADFAETVGRHGLTPVQARALLMLEEPVPMSAVAGRLACDASNVTGLADRLEALGVAERVPSSDRRVKLLRLTDRGAALRDELAERLSRGSAVTDRLTAAERDQLGTLLDTMLA